MRDKRLGKTSDIRGSLSSLLGSSQDIAARWAWPALCLILPVAFYFAIFSPLISRVVAPDSLGKAQYMFQTDASCMNAPTVSPSANDAPSDPKNDSVEKKRQKPSADPLMAMRASDISGRYGFAIPSAFGRFVAFVAFAFALYVMQRRLHSTKWEIRGLIIIAIIAFGSLVGYELNALHGTRAIIVDGILEQAPAQILTPSQIGTSYALGREIDAEISWNLYFGGVATIAILAALASVAYRGNIDALTPDDLRARMFYLKHLLGAEVAILIFLIIVTKGSVDWVIGLLCEPQRIALQPISAALGYYWGAAATGVIMCGLFPAYAAWRQDVNRFADAAKPSASAKERIALIEDEDLNFAPTTSILTILTIATPALTGPLVDVLRSLLAPR